MKVRPFIDIKVFLSFVVLYPAKAFFESAESPAIETTDLARSDDDARDT
jgi:hypothetical protein